MGEKPRPETTFQCALLKPPGYRGQYSSTVLWKIIVTSEILPERGTLVLVPETLCGQTSRLFS